MYTSIAGIDTFRVNYILNDGCESFDSLRVYECGLTKRIIADFCSYCNNGLCTSKYYIVSSLKGFKNTIYFHEDINWDMLNNSIVKVFTLAEKDKGLFISVRDFESNNTDLIIEFDCGWQ